MYNKFLERLLENNYKSGLSKHGIRIRKIISPVIRFIVPFVTPNSKLNVLRRAEIPKAPVIFAATHGFREDAEHTVVMAGRQAYALNGSLEQTFNSFDGIALWLGGICYGTSGKMKGFCQETACHRITGSNSTKNLSGAFFHGIR